MKLIKIGRTKHRLYEKDIFDLVNSLSKNKNERVNLTEAYYAHERCSAYCVGALYEPNGIVGIGYLYTLNKPNGKIVGQIEDVVVRQGFRGLGFAGDIVEALKIRARELNCYKVVLNCSPDLELFYNRLGFKDVNKQMAIYYER